MADPSPSTSRPAGGERRASSSGELRSGPSSSRASVPPSEPRPSRASFDALDAQLDRPARLQMILALLLGLVLVAIPLYLWRRPRAEPLTVSTERVDAGVLPTVSGASTPSTEEELALGDPKILSCHDPGPKKTPPEQCDHVATLEQAFAKAIEDSASCVPRDAGGGTILFVADVNFKRRTLSVGTPKEGRTLKSSKIAIACERAVKAKLAPRAFQPTSHEHVRYRVSITATYPAAGEP